MNPPPKTIDLKELCEVLIAKVDVDETKLSYPVYIRVGSTTVPLGGIGVSISEGDRCIVLIGQQPVTAQIKE